jgi:(p)ppGpp synthase/HD superfamily hydrolase
MADADDLVVRAERFATRWHAGQTDKLGAPYISHPRRVAARLTVPEQQVVAWLHDVLEDTGATLHDYACPGAVAHTGDTQWIALVHDGALVPVR